MLKSDNAVVNRITHESSRNLCILAERKSGIVFTSEMEELFTILQKLDGPCQDLGHWAEIIHYACEARENKMSLSEYLYWLRYRYDLKSLKSLPLSDINALNGAAYRARDIHAAMKASG